MQQILLTPYLNELEQVEQNLPPGNYMLVMQTPEPLPQDIIQNIQLELLYQGVKLLGPVTQTYTSPNEVQISYQKPISQGIGQWQLVLGMIVPLAIIGTVIFGIFNLEQIKNALIPILLIGGGIVITLAWILREPASKAIARYV